MTSNTRASIFMAASAVILGATNKYCPESECFFMTSTCACSLLFVAGVADPATFFSTLFALFPFIRSVLPKRVSEHIDKSIECLQEGEFRVAESLKKKGQSDKTSGDGDAISTRMILNEIRKRIQWRFVIPTIITGAIVRAMDYEKPKVVGLMLDSVVKDGATMETAFWPYFRKLVLLVIFDFVLISMREYFKHAALHRFKADALTDMMANILDQEMDYINSDENSAGFIHLMNRETARMEALVNQGLPRLTFALISSVCGIYTLIRVDYRLALVGVFVKSPLMIAIQRMSRKDIVKYGMLYDASVGDAARTATSILKPEVIHLLQANVAQNRLVKVYRSKQEKFIEYLESTHFRQTMLCMVNHGLRNVEDVMLLAMGLANVLEGNLTVGQYLTFRSHLALLDSGPKELINLWNDVVTIRLQAARYFELLYRKSAIPCSSLNSCTQMPPENTHGGLELSLKRVSFSYRTNPDVKILDNVDLDLRPGKVIALCGGSGGGKTTVMRLLQRFYDPTDGRIELNSRDIRSLDVAWLRSKVAVVAQDPILLDMTLWENIALGLSEEDVRRGDSYVRKKVIEAAKLAEAHDFIVNKCEKGYDTNVRMIHRLSGGQRQRIAIARALISRAPVLICDEVTSALDSDTEKIVISTLFEAMRGKSVLVIAHRMSTIRNADEILFLEHGKVVERGTHHELLEKNGHYANYLSNHRVVEKTLSWLEDASCAESDRE